MKTSSLFVSLVFYFLFNFSSQARTLIVGVGKEFAEPQQAFEACENGDEIKILRGNYTINTSFGLIKKKDIKIYGVGEVWLLASETYYDVFRVIGCKNIVIQNIRMKHLEPENERTDEFSCGGSVLVLESCKNVLVKKCEMNGCGRVGIDFSFSEDYENIRIEKCKIHHNSFCAVKYKQEPYFSEEGLMFFKWLKMKGNKIRNNGTKEVDVQD